MNKLRLPGSWKARVQSVAGGAAAAYASSIWALVQGWQDSRPPPLLWGVVVAAGAAVMFAGLAVLLLHRRGAIEFIGPEEEEALRKRRVLTLGTAGAPIRGVGPAEEDDGTPSHVKSLMVAAALSWGGALPVCAFFEWDSLVRLFVVWVAVVATLSAALTFFWHKTRTAARIVSQASED
ncbi:hypothetical protein EPO15_14765 [bacterium]|nr:MAG: hypothetical protein EPO15_14765 [bacterium]